MKITDVEIRLTSIGFPYMVLKLDGKEARIGIEQKLINYGAVALGPDWEDDPRARFILAADPEDGRPEPMVIPGHHGDARLVRLANWFLDATENGTFEPGPVDLDELLKGG